MAQRGTTARRASQFLPVPILLILSGVAWVATYGLATPDMRVGLLTAPPAAMDGMGSMPGSSMALGLFMATWLVMMVAMMFPAVSPVVLTFDRWVRSQGRSRAATAVFVAGYLLVWGVVGLVAYAILLALQAWVPAGDVTAVRAGAVVLALAGAYQLTPLKRVCLRHCRSPLAVVAQHARQLMGGGAGPLRVGLVHGSYCLGCCWSLMLVLVLLGLMNLIWMALIAAVILVEKAVPHGERFSRVVGVALVLLGVLLAAAPHAVSLPG